LQADYSGGTSGGSTVFFSMHFSALACYMRELLDVRASRDFTGVLLYLAGLCIAVRRNLLAGLRALKGHCSTA
jgi:hypothetical protein